MYNYVKNDNLEREHISWIPLLPHLSLGLFSHFRGRKWVIIQMQWLMVRGGRWLRILLWREHSKIVLELNWTIELLGCFILVGLHFTLQETQIIIIPTHILLPITFRVMFLQDITPWELHFCKKKEQMLKDFWNQLRTFGLQMM